LINRMRRGVWRLRGFARSAPAAIGLVAVCLGVFLIQQTAARVDFVAVYGYRYGYDQALLHCFGLSWPLLREGFVWQLVTYMFLHASWQHLAMNMLTVLLLGSGLEAEIGRRRFKWIFLTGGLLGGLGWLMVTALTPLLPSAEALTQWLPRTAAAWLQAGASSGQTLDVALCIGASGGVFALIGAYSALFPRREVYVLLLFFPLRLKARTLAWFLGAVTVAEAVFVQSRVAYAAHLAGGIAGYLCGCALRTEAGDWRGGVPYGG